MRILVEKGVFGYQSSAIVFIALSMLWGCVTVGNNANQRANKYTLADLQADAARDPLVKPAFESANVEEIPFRPLGEEYLVGKWFSKSARYMKVWWTDGSDKQVSDVRRAKKEMEFEFAHDGTFCLKQRFTSIGSTEWHESVSSGKWHYSEDNGFLVLVYENGQTDNSGYECKVVWLSEDRMAIRGRSEAFDAENSMKMWRDKYGWIHCMNDVEKRNDISHAETLMTPEHFTRISKSPKTSFKILSLHYNANTRTGAMSILFDQGKYEDARKYIRKNIETLARDKNIALTTGEIPPAAKFYLGREEIKDGNILEIEFKTE